MMFRSITPVFFLSLLLPVTADAAMAGGSGGSGACLNPSETAPEVCALVPVRETVFV